MNVFVLIADIVNSKEIVDRSQFQVDLKNALEEINKSSQRILSPFTITLGDEFQAIYQSSENLLNDIFRILAYVYPTRVRFAVAYGEITTEINRENAIGMDGPAFHIARAGMNDLKKFNYSIIQFFGDFGEANKLINIGLKLSLSLMADWKQNTFLIFTKLFNNKSVKEIAPLLTISERGVYKIINTQKLRNFTEYFFQLERTIKKSDNK